MPPKTAVAAVAPKASPVSLPAGGELFCGGGGADGGAGKDDGAGQCRCD